MQTRRRGLVPVVGVLVLIAAAVLAGVNLTGSPAHELRQAVLRRSTGLRPRRLDRRRITANVDYGPAELTAFYDPSRTDAAWIGIVHGGSWYTGSRLEYDALARQWRDDGFAVFTIDYRLAPAAQWPAQRNDITTAVDYIRAHAATYHLNAADGVLVGHSAGGQIVTNAVDSGAVHVRGVVDLSGAVDPYLAWRHGHDAAAAGNTLATDLSDYAVLLMGCPPAPEQPACWARWRDASSPAHVRPGLPPTLIIQSSEDPVVPAQMSVYYADRLAEEGDPYTLRLLPDETTHRVIDLPGVADEVIAWIRAHTAVTTP